MAAAVQHGSDRYRAPCRPFPDIVDERLCRECGEFSGGRRSFYCSRECRDTFDADHFWGTARLAALSRASIWSIGRGDHRGLTRPPLGYVCARCEGFKAWEVNHIEPVNGDRQHFSCRHHQTNLEVLCHQCHLIVTAEQRAAGLIGHRGE